MAVWSDHAIWWHLHPLTFLGAPGLAGQQAGVEHRLDRLGPWLDYLVELGCNGLALGPIFAGESHGYDTVDHYRIDPRLGTDEDFDRLVERCRERGVRLQLDGVFNHVGRGFGPFQDVLAHGRDSQYASWFRLDFDAPGEDGDGFDYVTFEGHRHLVALNHDEPAVQAYVSAVMEHWLDRGADAWRLDAAYAVPREFWHEVTGRVRAGHPDVWLMGEYIHGDYVAAVREGGLDSATQYELWKAIWSSLSDGNFFELSWALSRHDEFAEAMHPLTFVGNHDVTRIASRIEDERHLPHALTILFTVAGVPSVYAGDEQAFQGVKYERADGDAEVRPAFPEQGPNGLAPFGRPIYRLHQDLIGLRRRHPWLLRARVRTLHLENRVFGYEVADPEGTGRLAVLLNISDEPHAFVLGAGDGADAADGAKSLLGSGEDGPIGQVEPHGWAIVELEA